MSEESSNVADLGAAGDPTGLEQPSSKNLGAVVKTPMPTLRVEELRDEDGHSSSGKHLKYWNKRNREDVPRKET